MTPRPPLVLADARNGAALWMVRALFAAAGVLSAIGAAMYAWVPMPSTAGLRGWLVGACAAGALACGLTVWRLRAAHLRRAVLGLGWLIVALVGVVCIGSGDGISSPNNGYIVLAVCIVAMLVGLREGLWLAGTGLALAAAMALAEAAGWLPGGTSVAARPLGVRLLALALVLVAGTLVAAFVARTVARQLRELDRRREHFQALLRIAADAYWELDEQLRYTRFDGAVAGATTLDAGAHLGRHPWQLPLGLSDDALDAHRADLESRVPFHGLLTRWPGRDGRSRYISISGEPRFDERGVFRGYWGVSQDITDSVRVRLAREQSETRYRELFDRSPSALVVHRSGVVVEANPVALHLLGYADPESIVGCQWLDHCHGSDAQERTSAHIVQLEKLAVGDALPVIEVSLRALGGRELRVRLSSIRIDADGGPAALTMFDDQTQRRAAENALRGSQALLARLLATSPDLIALTSMESGRFVLVNDSVTRVLGYSADEVIGRTSAELGTWYRYEDRGRLLDALQRDGIVQNMPVSFVAKSGVPVPMLVSAAGFEADGREYVVVNARDISDTERTRLEREVMFASASIGIAFTRGQAFVQANPRFEQMFGWPEGSLAGQPERVVWSGEAEYREIERALRPQLVQGQQVEVERLVRRRDGGEFWCRVLAKAVDPSRPGAGTVWIAEDVTERHRVAQALAQARDAAEAANRAKSAFLANTSHELRTPLNGLLGMARLAQQPDLDPVRRQRYIEQIADSAKNLSDIIADILDLSKIEAGKLSLEDVPFDFVATVRELHHAYLELAKAHGLAFTLAIDDGVPRRVRGDPVRVRQILSNYVTNALKFTPDGSVQIELTCGRGSALRLAVRDSGPGIDAATRQRLFHPFTQADGSTTRRFGGTGLGLSICRELATLMGGSVGVDSEPGRGSVFWAELPLPATDEDDPVSGYGALDERPLAGAHVLVVEDNAVNMMICVALLEQQGVRVAQAGNGREAVEAVQRAARAGDAFDAVLMDVQMPVMSGHEAARALRRAYDMHTLPIIALTAAALVSEREQALAAGMNDFLTKPIEPRYLLRALARALSQTA